MPIRQFLGNDAAFGPEDLQVMSAAFSAALAKLKLSVTRDPLVEMVARRIIRAALSGERDPERLCELALEGDGSEAA
jgi:hypothetical protein